MEAIRCCKTHVTALHAPLGAVGATSGSDAYICADREHQEMRGRFSKLHDSLVCLYTAPLTYTPLRTTSTTTRNRALL